jgi:hypothetical protein
MEPEQHLPESSDMEQSGAPADIRMGEGGERALSLMERLYMIFTSPDRVFRDLAARPRWIGAFLTVVVISIVSTQAIFPLIEQARNDQILNSPRYTEEQAREMIEQMEAVPPSVARVFTVVMVTFSQMVWLLVSAGLLMFGCNVILGGEGRFSQMLSVAAHASLVAIPKTLLTVPLMLSKQSLQVATSLQVLLPMDQWGTPAGVLLGAVDVFYIWTISLIVMGISAVYGFTKGKAATLVVSIYLLIIFLLMGLSALFSGLAGG